jgi:hypothetical protein
MLGSVECIHWRWNNYLAAWHDQYSYHHHDPTIMLEVVVSEDRWI